MRVIQSVDLRIKLQITRLECYLWMVFILCKHRTKRKFARFQHQCSLNVFVSLNFPIEYPKFHFHRNYSVSSTSGRLLRIGDPHGSAKPYLTKLCQLRDRLVRNGKYDVETVHNRSTLPHIIIWFQTDEAMVMYLSNHIVQVNDSTILRRLDSLLKSQ